MDLRKWKPTSTRRAGLCQDHFSPESFQPNRPERLRAGMVPQPFIEENNTSRIDVNSVIGENSNSLPSVNAIESSASIKTKDKDENEMLGIIDSSEKNSNIRTYSRKTCEFNLSAEEENPNQWIAIEPIVTRTEENIEGTSKNDVKYLRMIHRLKHEVFLLKQKNERLKKRAPFSTKSNRKISHKTLFKKGRSEILRIAQEIKLSRNAQTVLKLQLHIPNTPYDADEKNYAKKIYFRSTSAVHQMRKSGAILPAVSTMQRWLNDYDIRPGFCDPIFNKIGEKLRALPPEQRVCCLKWDETTIKAYQEYSSKLDEIEGLVDIGPLGRSSETASSVFVFFLDSLNAEYPWRQPLAYFLSKGPIKLQQIVQLTYMCLDRLHEIGADVRAVVCDQGTPNQEAYKIFGVSEFASSFTYNNRIYYAIFDFPHLIKRLLSYLRAHKILYRNGIIVASWHDYVKAKEIDQNNTGGSNLLSHITDRHLNPDNFESMNVKRAFQILSRRYALAMKASQSRSKSLTVSKTINFTKKMNKVIDAFNSFSLKITVGGKCVLSPENQESIDCIEEFATYASALSKSSKECIQLPFMKGLQMIARSVIALYKTILNNYPQFRLATGLCNQDSVEHLFSMLRQRGGFNPNPTARSVRTSLRHIISTGYIYTSEKGNVKCIPADILTNTAVNGDEISSTMSDNSESESESNENIDINNDNILNSCDENFNLMYDQLDFYDKQCVAYFAGAISCRPMKKFQCVNCHSLMSKIPMDPTTPEESYINDREYNHDDTKAPEVYRLQRPITTFSAIIAKQLEHLEAIKSDYWAARNIIERLTEQCIATCNKYHPDWFSKKNPCFNHRVYAFQYMTRVRLNAQAKRNNDEIKEDRKRKRALNLLSKRSKRAMKTRNLQSI